MLRNILIAAVALSAIAVGSAGTASASGYYNNHNQYKSYYKPHYKNYVKKYYVKKHYNYDYNDNYYNGGYYVQNDCGWQTVKVIRWNHGYRYIDFVKTWTCSGY